MLLLEAGSTLPTPERSIRSIRTERSKVQTRRAQRHLGRTTQAGKLLRLGNGEPLHGLAGQRRRDFVPAVELAIANLVALAAQRRHQHPAAGVDRKDRVAPP